MAITSITSPEQNASFYSDDPYDAKVVADFFYSIQYLWARQSVDGGNQDRLDAAVIMGTNSEHLFMDRIEESFATQYQFVIEAENEKGTEFRTTVPSPATPTVYPYKLDRPTTQTWCNSVLAAMQTCKATLGLPFYLPPPIILDDIVCPYHQSFIAPEDQPIIGEVGVFVGDSEDL